MYTPSFNLCYHFCLALICIFFDPVYLYAKHALYFWCTYVVYFMSLVIVLNLLCYMTVSNECAY